MKHILVPVDFSAQALCAIKVAANIAKKTNADIFLLHMIEMPDGAVDAINGGGESSTPASLLFMKKVHERFDELKNSVYLKGITVKESVHFHKTFDGVIEESKNQDIDLIVMGSSGATGLKEMMIGSNTEKVVRHSEIPVLVVKDGSADLEINTITFASDFSAESKTTFQNVIDFAKIFDAKIHLLYVNTPHKFSNTQKIRTTMANFVADFNVEDFETFVYNETTVEKGILNYSDEINADLIAINTHGRSGLSSFFTPSVSQDLANHAMKPIITFKI